MLGDVLLVPVVVQGERAARVGPERGAGGVHHRGHLVLHLLGHHQHGHRRTIGDAHTQGFDDGGGRCAARHQDGVGRVSPARRGLHAGSAAALNHDGGLAGVEDQFAAAGMELLHQEVNQVRQADPAFAGVENGVVRHGTGIDAGSGCGDFFRGKQLGVVANGLLVGVPGPCSRTLSRSVPHKSAAELEPLPLGIRGEERAVAVHARNPQLVVRRGPFACGVEPGQGTAAGFAGQAALSQEDHGGAFAEQVHGGGNAQDAAADYGDALGGCSRGHWCPFLWNSWW